MSKSLIEQLQDIFNSGNADHLNDEEALELFSKLSIYNQSVSYNKQDPQYNKVVAYCLTNLQEKYMEKLMTTALIGYMFRAADEYGVPDGEPIIHMEDLDKRQIIKDFLNDNTDENGKFCMNDYIINPEQHNFGGENLIFKETSYNKLKRMIIMEFLNHIFAYNPDFHIRNSYVPNKKDKSRSVVDEKSNPLNKYNHMNEYEMLVNNKPPIDLFGSFQRYYNKNYEVIEKACNDLYAYKSHLSYAINILDVFDNEEEFKKFELEREKSFITKIRGINMGKWYFQSMLEGNKDTEKVLNSELHLFEEILNANRREEEFLKDIVNKRIEKKKKKENQDDDDSELVNEYKKSNNKMSAPKVKKQKKKGYDMLLERRNMAISDFHDVELPENALQVDIFSVDVKSGKVNKDHIFTKSEEVEKDSVIMVNNK